MSEKKTLIAPDSNVIRGEVAELKVQIESDLAHKATPEHEKSLRERVTSVVKYMTSGVDVSSLFTTMIMVCSTQDLVTKKLVYTYLTKYAETNQELSILCVNTIQRDCEDTSPQVRGLAIRTLSSLCIRVRSLCEYVTPLVMKLIKDPSTYVRKHAVFAASKVFRATEGQASGLVGAVRKLYRDHDAQVAMNALAALQEMLGREGVRSLGLIDKDFIVYNLNRMRDLSEWSLCLLLDWMTEYVPTDERFVLDIFNTLDDKLKHTNSGVVLGVVNVFFKYAESAGMTGIYQQIFVRVKGPLLLLLSTLPDELAYPLLLHVRLLLARSPRFLENDYAHFFIRGNEPRYIKALKLDVLTLIATVRNAKVILEELNAYVADVDSEVSEQAVRCFGKVALALPEIIPSVCPILLYHLDLEIEHISAAVLLVLKDLVRHSPALRASVCPYLTAELLQLVSGDSRAKAAGVWLVGELGALVEEDVPDDGDSQQQQQQQQTGDLLGDLSGLSAPTPSVRTSPSSERYLVADAPYLLEELVDGWEEQDFHVKLELLTALVKLFVARPAEVQPVLGKALSMGCGDADLTEVHDKALLYYRLLQSCAAGNALGILGGVVAPQKGVVRFEDGTAPELSDELFEEFNTLSVVYGKPAQAFVTPTERYYRAPACAAPIVPLGSVLPVQPGALVVGTAPQHAAAASNAAALGTSVPSFRASPDTLAREAFLELWGRLAACDELHDVFKGDAAALLEAAERGTFQYLKPVASGVVGTTAKLYAYGQSADGVYVLAEVLVDTTTGEVSGTFKCADPAVGARYADVLGDQLFPLPDTPTAPQQQQQQQQQQQPALNILDDLLA